MTSPDHLSEHDIKNVGEWIDTGSINIFGRPFAGKDTQANVLAKLFRASVLGGGAILRASVIPEYVKEIMHRGELVPSDAYVDIVLPYLSSDELAGRPLILSSLGRMDGEQEGVLRATEASGHPTKAVIYLDVDEETVIERWHGLHLLTDRGDRADDNLESLHIRLKEFRDKTIPVIEDYRKRGLLIEVDGTRSEKDVTVLILRELAQRALTSRA